MGIDYKAKFMVGKSYEDYPLDKQEELDEVLDNGELDYASPYYDSEGGDWFVGVEISRRYATVDALVKDIEQARAYLSENWGGSPDDYVVMASLHVY